MFEFMEAVIWGYWLFGYWSLTALAALAVLVLPLLVPAVLCYQALRLGRALDGYREAA